MSDTPDIGRVSATELLACPFCGGEAQPALVHAGGLEWAQVECVERGCGAVGPTPATEAEAIAAWNTRAPIEAARASERAAVQWQPIETAPKDGTVLLLHNSRQAVTAVAWWSKAHCFWQSNGAGVIMHQPTHWMPLPPPPAIEQGGGE